jgi:hypothetical protein
LIGTRSAKLWQQVNIGLILPVANSTLRATSATPRETYRLWSAPGAMPQVRRKHRMKRVSRITAAEMGLPIVPSTAYEGIEEL